MWTDAFCDVVLVPGENADGFADGDQLEAQFHLSAEPDVIADYAVLSRVGATLPNSSAEQEGAGLHRHVPIRIDGSGYGDLVEQVKEVELAIQHNGGSEDGVGASLIKFLKGVG